MGAAVSSRSGWSTYVTLILRCKNHLAVVMYQRTHTNYLRSDNGNDKQETTVVLMCLPPPTQHVAEQVRALTRTGFDNEFVSRNVYLFHISQPLLLLRSLPPIDHLPLVSGRKLWQQFSYPSLPNTQTVKLNTQQSHTHTHTQQSKTNGRPITNLVL